MTRSLLRRLACAWLALATAQAFPAILEEHQSDNGSSLSSCPGYKASNVKTSAASLTADLTLAGVACNVYGTDIQDLTLTVEYQTDTRLHIIIQDAAKKVYQVPTSVLPRPNSSDKHGGKRELEFDYREYPFSFSVKRKSNGDVLFDTSAASLVFESQYLRLRTRLPESPSLYGLGEHTDPFMLNTTAYVRTLWNRDAYTVPSGTNLYGDHPIYFDHRGVNGTHGVFLLNSNGMNIVIDDHGGQHLEYNIIGGVLDFYFIAGPSPVEVAQQYSEIVGKSAMMPYWGFGFHQCRYGMVDVYEVAGVVANYSAAGIPLETMWTDIDYMYLRRVFTLDQYRFPLNLMQELVRTIHDREQHYIVMVDPAVAYQNYPPFENGVEANAFLKEANGSVYKGVVWPGVTAFPDWFAPGTQSYWNGEFDSFFNAETGVDIDALWIDMNEASNFCVFPCTDPELQATQMGDPPPAPPIRLGSPVPVPGFPVDFQPRCHASATFNVNASTFLGENIYLLGSAITLGAGIITNAVPMSADTYPIWSITVDMPVNANATYEYVRAEPNGGFVYESTNRSLSTGDCGSSKMVNDQITTVSPPHKRVKRVSSLAAYSSPLEKPQISGSMIGLPGRDLIAPAFKIDNAAGSLSNKTLNTSLIHYGGYAEYDTHNLYGAMMSESSRLAMLSRRPTVRPMVITRSTFAGSGRQVGHWLGDNVADWSHYLISIAELLEFGALFQLPMVGSDVCGYAGISNDKLCARWASLGAFSPFYRNHQGSGTPPHEFYRWPLTTSAAQNAINTRYILLDYFYTAFYDQNQTGTPSIQPMFFVYPEDKNANSLQYQYFFGPALMVAPVTEENSTTTTIYMPKDTFYDFWTHEHVQGLGNMVTLKNVDYTSIPLYYRGGQIVVQRANSSNTTAELRKQDFSVVIAPSANGSATGNLYLDDGDSILQRGTSYIQFNYADGTFSMTGSFGYNAGLSITSIVVLGTSGAPNSTSYGRRQVKGKSTVLMETSIPLTRPQSIQVG